MPAFWMLLASLLFASMGVCVKFASDHFNSAELVFWRGAIGVLLLWAIARTRGIKLATPHLGMHGWRAAVGVISLGCWFYSLAELPLATAMTLNYMSSIWIALFVVGAALLSWRPTAARRPGHGAAPAPKPPGQGLLVFTVLIGFAGVLLLLRPSLGADQGFAALVGLASGLLAALAYLQVMALAKVGEPEARTVFYFALASAAAGALALPVAGVSAWDWRAALWLPPIGLFASLGQLCMTRAFSRGATLVVANLQYFGIVFAALYSLWLFDDRIAPLGWLGMALIVASGLAATALRARAEPAPVAPNPPSN